jgi:transcriptional regulator NrdR family protein
LVHFLAPFSAGYSTFIIPHFPVIRNFLLTIPFKEEKILFFKCLEKSKKTIAKFNKSCYNVSIRFTFLERGKHHEYEIIQAKEKGEGYNSRRFSKSFRIFTSERKQQGTPIAKMEII